MNALRTLGYEAVWQGERSWNGVAILARHHVCGQRKSPDFAASSVSDRIAFAYSSSRNRTEHVPSREKLGIYRFHFRAVRSLQSGLSTNNREIRALFAYFGADRAEILCSSDCMAEEERFELSVRFCRAKARRVCKLQIAKPCQRISPETGHQNWAISPVSIRHLFAHERRMQGDSAAKDGHVLRFPGSLTGFAGLRAYRAVRKAKNLSAGCAPRKANKWRFSEILVHAS